MSSIARSIAPDVFLGGVNAVLHLGAVGMAGAAIGALDSTPTSPREITRGELGQSALVAGAAGLGGAVLTMRKGRGALAAGVGAGLLIGAAGTLGRSLVV